MTDYNVEGLSYTTANYTTAATPPTQQCAYFVKLVGKQFIVQNNNQEICGTLIPGA